MDDCLQYVGGTVGAVTLSSIAAATAYYYATRPSPQIPLVPLEDQSPILDVSYFGYFVWLASSNTLLGCVNDMSTCIEAHLHKLIAFLMVRTDI